jgi:PAS domain S-box-containing protein
MPPSVGSPHEAQGSGAISQRWAAAANPSSRLPDGAAIFGRHHYLLATAAVGGITGGRETYNPEDACRGPAVDARWWKRAPLNIPLLESPTARRQAFAASAITVAVIAVLDWKVKPNVSLGFLYVFPILVISLFATRGQIVAVATACGILREVLSPLSWDGDAAARLLMGLVAFLGAGLFVSELARNHRLAVEHAAQLKRQIDLREEIAEDLRVLVESSPAAIFTLDGEGRILLANEAAQRLLGLDNQPAAGEAIEPFLPALVSALERPRLLLRTNMECIGRRRSGDVFLAHVWFSTYQILSGTRLAAIVFDASEQLRDREVMGLGSVAAASRVLFGAVSHEVRNLAAAAAVAHVNLSRHAGLAEDQDFRALGALVSGLERIASSDLRLGSSRAVDSIDLRNVLDELRIVVDPACREDGIAVEWRLAPGLPLVMAEPHSLLQIFLNLAQNAQREMARSEERRLCIGAAPDADGVVVSFEDTGPGVRRPEILFRPFPEGGPATGLGLFVSRTIARSFAGDVRYEPRDRGSCFSVHLASADRGAVPA